MIKPEEDSLCKALSYTYHKAFLKSMRKVKRSIPLTKYMGMYTDGTAPLDALVQNLLWRAASRR